MSTSSVATGLVSALAPQLPAAFGSLAQFLALDSATRLYDIEIDGLNQASTPLQLEAFTGDEALSALYHFDLLLLSTNTRIDLGKLVGRQAKLITRLADGSDFPRTGYISRAEHLGADGALSRYRIRIVPWLWLATQRADCRVFQEKTVLQIVESVFCVYAPRAHWQLAEGVEAFMDAAPPRSYCVQYRESDYDFVSRLLAEEGLGYCFVEQNDVELHDAPCHSLLLFANNDALPEDQMSSHALGGTGIRFHKAGSQETQDAVTAFGATRVLQAAVSTALSWGYKGKRSISASVPTDHDFGSKNAPYLESYDVPGAYAFADSGAAERYVRLAREALEARNKQFAGSASVRSFRPGHRFVLSNSPLDNEALLRSESADASTANASRHFMLLGVSHAGVNNLPKNLAEASSSLGDVATAASSGNDASLAALLDQAKKRGYANHFSAQRVFVPWRPALADEHGTRLNPRPTVAGVQSAIVVGAEGETVAGAAGEIHTDALHRVRVKFHWQRGRAAANDDTSPHTAWLRMASRYAGKGLGAQFVPRIGQEVLVGFMDGDIDRPVVLGSLYNGKGDGGVAPTPGGTAAADAPDDSPFTQAADHRPAAQGNLARGNSPAWHGESSAYGPHRNRAALSGFKSSEYGSTSGTAFNQLVFDDSDNQQRIQLATTQAASQLNLGHLVHQADNYRGSHRGNGFELRTDGYGALRSARGTLFTTWPIQAGAAQASSEPAGDATAPVALLKQAAQLVANTSQIATTHKTVAVAAHMGSNKANASTLNKEKPAVAAQHAAASGMLDTKFDNALSDAGKKATTANAKKIPHSTDALLTLAAKGGLGLVAGQDLQFANGESITLASGQDSNFALADKLRIHAGQALGILSSAQGQGSLKAIAAQGPVLVQAQADTMTLAAKEQLKMIAVNDKLDLAANKKVHMAVAGGAAITIEGGKITVQCPGTLTVHASQKSFVGGGKAEVALPKFSQGPLEFKFKRRFAFSV
ncbi:type VI secretion system tip protein TssI/VgrG [Uliginosibacterium sp. H3]|uniref:Type VI secretion system tip protein TssI/VgrG n=1 Tax=Uliginosibacterium silvisoli TaxID=3114758 RepID=A0ABU6K6D6_9RHOO|nr:type VI secretion system tip protein TssI/VgrG [Uliginosibacterium sp. H3]